MRLVVSHCLCLLCMALLTHGKEHAANDSAEHHDHDHNHEHDHHENDHDQHHEGHDHSSHEHDTHAERAHHPSHVRLEDKGSGVVEDYRIWLAATASILLISLCGVFGVIVIPIMQRVFYQHLIQFLIALAVGTLAGDALLHLLPHAFMARIGGGGHQHDKHDDSQHEAAVWLGFTATLAILGFFFFEKLVNVLGEWREGRTREAAESRELEVGGEVVLEQERKLRVVREGHAPSDKAIGERLCKHKYSSYCVTDFEPTRASSCTASPSCARRTSEPPMGPRPDLLDPSQAGTLLSNGQQATMGNPAYTVGPGNGKTLTESFADRDTVIISEHEVAHHGHSHAHSHLHSAPENISSVAWMVIFGDGIHNLADGLAIGAAFADGAMSGFSTSVAVLCHELPHEIGDFAMLLKAGMTIKQAVFYNVLSSILAFMGMLAGLALGNLDHFSSWMFAATAGIFLYVALVDMMPELSSGHAHPISRTQQHGGQWVGLLLHLLGMSLGVSIMLLIALYEHQLKNVFGDEEH